MNLAVFASGGGSNFEAIAAAGDDGSLPANVRLVVSDRGNAGVLERARLRAIPSSVVAPADFDRVGDFAAALMTALEEHEISHIALAGYLKQIPGDVVRAYRHRMLNVHPSLLPAFGGKGLYGRRVHEAVLGYGVRWTGATVHFVDEEYDTGPILLQEPVPVAPDDTAEALAARVQAVEHRLYPEALRLVSEGRVQVEGRRVLIRR